MRLRIFLFLTVPRPGPCPYKKYLVTEILIVLFNVTAMYHVIPKRFLFCSAIQFQNINRTIQASFTSIFFCFSVFELFPLGFNFPLPIF